MGEDIVMMRKQALNDDGNFYSEIDPIRGVRNARTDFGVAHVATAMVTLATAAVGATRGRVVAMVLFAAAATNYTFTDNAVGIFTTLLMAATGNLFLSKSQLGDGGIIFTTDFTCDPTANSSIVWIAWIPEYDAYEE